MNAFTERLAVAVAEKGPLCVGLDPHLGRLPQPFRAQCQDLQTASGRKLAAEAVGTWSRQVIQAVAGQVAILKPQIALFEQMGAAGLGVLEELVNVAQEAGLLVLMDAKRGDIGSTAEAYAKALLDDDGPFGCDAVTLSPYLGRDSMAPFIQRCERNNKGVFILLRTSNPGGAELQRDRAQVADLVASWVNEWNEPLLDANGFGPVGVVVGATLGTELTHWRAALPHAWFLMPGYGAQGASAADTRAGHRKDGLGALINSSRGVLFAGPGEEQTYAADPTAFIREKTRLAITDLAEAKAH
jgi:orotidine-5'-phosphate decarboxylase